MTGSEIITHVLQRAQLPGGLTWEMQQALSRLAPHDKAALMLLMRTSAGMGMGALVVQFLASRGLLNTGLGALAGGALAYATAPRFPSGQVAPPALSYWTP